MKIILDTPYTEVLAPARTRYVDSITITSMTDNPVNRTVYVTTNIHGRVLLWEAAEYDAVGQWTDQDVIDRIKEIYNL